jgi:hypothetical protein
MIGRTGLTVGAIALAGPLTIMQIACGSTKSLVKWAGIVIGALKDVSPILADIGASDVVALVAKAIPIAEKLKNAFEDNDHASTLQFLDNLINPQTGIIVEIANAVTNLTDERKKFVQGILAIGMVALRLIAANIEDEVPPAAATVARARNPRAVGAVQRAASRNSLEAAFNAVKF